MPDYGLDLYAVEWQGYRTGDHYITLYDHQPAAALAFYHLLAEQKLPDYSPGNYRHEPVATIERGKQRGAGPANWADPDTDRVHYLRYLTSPETPLVGDD